MSKTAIYSHGTSAGSREFEVTIEIPTTKEEILARLQELAKEDFALRTSNPEFVPGVESAYTRAVAANAVETYRLNLLLTAACLREAYPSVNQTLH